MIVTCKLFYQPAATNEEHQPTIISLPGDRLPITVAAKISKSLKLKEEGNTLFKQQEWKKAIKKYHHSLMYAKGITDRPDKLMGMDIPTRFLKPTEEEERKAEEILVSAHNNIAGESVCPTALYCILVLSVLCSVSGEGL